MHVAVRVISRYFALYNCSESFGYFSIRVWPVSSCSAKQWSEALWKNGPDKAHSHFCKLTAKFGHLQLWCSFLFSWLVGPMISWGSEICPFPIKNYMGGGGNFCPPIHSLCEMDKLHWFATLKHNKLMQSNLSFHLYRTVHSGWNQGNPTMYIEMVYWSL